MRTPWQFVKKTSLLYGIATLIYLPISLYADNFRQAGLLDVLRACSSTGRLSPLVPSAAILGVLLVGL
jgi:hypothetical protein